jgi:hypothetical protein
MSQIIEANEIDQTVSASNPEVHRLLGIDGIDDPDQAVRRMIRQGVPHTASRRAS